MTEREALNMALEALETLMIERGSIYDKAITAIKEALAQRTWVGLTDDEIDQGLLRSDYAFKTAEAWRAGVVFAMTKLKEKNT